MKGAFEFGTRYLLLGLALTVIFFLLAYTFLFTDLGPRAVDAANFYVFSKVGVTVTQKHLGKITPEGILDAKITASPSSPVCSFEPVYFSANGSLLPKGMTFDNINCYWDFDLTSEPCDSLEPPVNVDCRTAGNDSDTTNDYESVTCDTKYSGAWPSSLGLAEKEGVKLLIIDQAGRRDEDFVNIRSTFFCACAAEGQTCPGGAQDIKLEPALGTELYSNDTAVVDILSIWKIDNFNLLISPIGKVQDLKIDVGDDGRIDYSFDGNITGEFVVSGQNLQHAIKKEIVKCEGRQETLCKVPIVFYFKGAGTVTIKEIWIPISNLA